MSSSSSTSTLGRRTEQVGSPVWRTERVRPLILDGTLDQGKSGRFLRRDSFWMVSCPTEIKAAQAAAPSPAAAPVGAAVRIPGCLQDTEMGGDAFSGSVAYPRPGFKSSTGKPRRGGELGRTGRGPAVEDPGRGVLAHSNALARLSATGVHATGATRRGGARRPTRLHANGRAGCLITLPTFSIAGGASLFLFVCPGKVKFW
eukprot:gene13476-biopygen12515